MLDSSQFSIVVGASLREKYIQYRNELHALLFVMSFLMLCNDISYYKPLQGVVSSGSKRGKQRTLGVLISGLS